MYEDGATLALMDKHPANDGHCLVITKEHYETVFEPPPEDFAAVARTVVKVAAAVQGALQPPGLSLVQANGRAAGQSVPHLHVHVLPRREKDDLADKLVTSQREQLDTHCRISREHTLLPVSERGSDREGVRQRSQSSEHVVAVGTY